MLVDQPDHQTWETQDVFALSIVAMEWLTYGMFTYPYNREAGGGEPSYAALLLYELQVELKAPTAPRPKPDPGSQHALPRHVGGFRASTDARPIGLTRRCAEGTQR